MNRICLSLAIILFAAFPRGDAQEADAPSELSADQKAIVDNALLFVEAFNRADAKAIAGLFLEDAEMSVDGVTVAKGRDSIERSYRDFFAERAGAQISVHVESFRQPRPNLIIEKGVSEIVNDDDDRVVDSYTAIHAKQDGKWWTVSADVQQAAVDDQPTWQQQLALLEGSWEASRGEWKVVTRFEWVAGGNFLKREFKVTERGEETGSGTQVIGWDPIEAVITAWSFGSDGGHGRAVWQRDGDQWIARSAVTTPEGSVVTATNVMTFLSPDAFRFQSTQRSLSGVALEDSESILVRRVQDESATPSDETK